MATAKISFCQVTFSSLEKKRPSCDPNLENMLYEAAVPNLLLPI